MKEKIKQLIQEIGISEIEKVLDEIKREKCSCNNKPAARDWFHNYLMGVSIYKKEGYPKSLFFKNKEGQDIMEQDYENDRLWVNYYRIWSVFKSKYDLKYEEIRDLIQHIVGETFKIKVSTPVAAIIPFMVTVGETFKIKVSTPAYEGLF